MTPRAEVARADSVYALVALGLPKFNARSSVNGPMSQWRNKGWVVEAGKKGRAMKFRLAPRPAMPQQQTAAAAASTDEETAACPVTL
ncbi:hypothetical protein ACW69C_30420 [Streptomyces sp. MN3]